MQSIKDRRVYVFDLDGVLIDVRERIRKVMEVIGRPYLEDPRMLRGRLRQRFWELFLSPKYMLYDRPRRVGIELFNERRGLGEVIIVTGRPIRLRKYTRVELESFGLSLEGVRIYFRKSGDFRKDYEYKASIIDGLKNVVEVHDDSIEVLDAISRLKPTITLYLHYDDNYVVYKRGT